MKYRILLIILLMFSPAFANAESPGISLIDIDNKQLPLWYNDKGFTKEGKRAFDVLKTAESHGISSERYEMGYFEDIHANKLTEPLKIKQANEKMTQSLVLYMLDLRFGVEASSNRLKKLTDAEKAEYQSYFGKLLSVVMREKDYEKAIDKFTSTSPQYAKLKDTLMFYAVLKKNKIIAPVSLAKAVKPGESNEAIPSIRHNLQLIKAMSKGEYEYNGKLNDSAVYDEAMQEDVKYFQKISGVEQSGKLDKALAAKISSYLDDSMAQIKLTLDKIRTNGDSFGNDKHLVINIPEYKLYAHNEGKLTFSMPVIVGKQGTATPEFKNKINIVVINPDWSPPHKITKNELLPKIRRNPEFLRKGGYEVKWSDGEVISSADYDYVDWDSVNVSDIRIKQGSGRGNALGHIKFLMPDNDSIYLHDTNSRNLFSKTFRALSHGCIRLGEPLKLAEFVLGPDFNEQTVQKKISRGSTQSVKADNIPVYTIYKTAWVDADGTLFTVPDVYGKEKTLAKKLAESGLKSGLVAEVSPAHPASYWAGINMNEIALSVDTHTP